MTLVPRTARVALGALGVRSRFVDTGVARHHVYEARGRGSLPPLVLLPGLADDAVTHAPLLLALRAHARRVVCVESAGHGLSGPARGGSYTFARHFASLTTALDRLLEEPALLVGNSLGGATALHYAHARPERVLGLYLTSPGAAPIDEAERDDLRRAFSPRTTAEAAAFLGRVFHASPPLAPVLARVMRRRAASPAVAGLLGSTDHLPATPEALAALRVPVTIVWGRSERLLPPSGLAYLRAHAAAHVVFAEPEGFGHCPHLDDPKRLAREIVRWAGAATSPA